MREREGGRDNGNNNRCRHALTLAPSHLSGKKKDQKEGRKEGLNEGGKA